METKDVSAIFVLFYILLAIEILWKWRASQLESYFLQMSGQRNSMISEGRLSYIFLLHFLSEEFYEKWKTSQL